MPFSASMKAILLFSMRLETYISRHGPQFREIPHKNIFSKYNVVFAIMLLVAYPQYEVFKMYFCLLCVIILVCKGMQCERREMMKEQTSLLGKTYCLKAILMISPPSNRAGGTKGAHNGDFR